MERNDAHLPSSAHVAHGLERFARHECRDLHDDHDACHGVRGSIDHRGAFYALECPLPDLRIEQVRNGGESEHGFSANPGWGKHDRWRLVGR
jgi:hypothetical protein